MFKLFAAIMLGGAFSNAFAEGTLDDKLADLESRYGARIGVALTDHHGNLLYGYRADERFAMCSTFKLPLAALAMHAADIGELDANEQLHYTESEIDQYAPAAKRYLATGFMTVREANLASLQLSDNTAANLLLARLGGPGSVTKFFRLLGDNVSRLDRNEPALNSNLDGDVRDTTTPGSMSRNVARLVYGDVLHSRSREELARMLVGNTTGDSTIRAGLPRDWIAGDKTGSCAKGGRNDVAFLIAPSGNKYALSVYLNAPSSKEDERNAVIATTANLLQASFK
ncbi:class A beta-lactamase [Luteimonas sp. e5]